MWLKGGPTPMYQSMWYTPGMGRGTAGPYIESICDPSAPNQSRPRKMRQGLSIQEPKPPSVDSEPADSEPSGMATSEATGNMPQVSPDQPAPLRCSTHTAQNQLPWKYQNFALLPDASPSSILEAWVGLCICLHLISCLYTIFMGSIV